MICKSHKPDKSHNISNGEKQTFYKFMKNMLIFKLMAASQTHLKKRWSGGKKKVSESNFFR